MRAALLLVLVTTLAGCSRPGELVTRRPLLKPGNAVGAPTFRRGVWRLIWPDTVDTPCSFDQAQPIQAWPSCNTAEWVGSDRMVSTTYSKTLLGSIPTERNRPYVLGAGSILVLQLYGDAYAGRYSYEAVDEVTLDGRGRIVAARLTPINCFKPEAFTAAMEWQANVLTDDNTHPIEDHPSPSEQLALAPGFLLEPLGECRPRDLAALRNAAAADAAASTEGVNFRWVRDKGR